MLLAKENIRHINSITHEGKVVVVATDAGGMLHYTIKQDGFEDSYLSQPAHQRTGWEDWKQLNLPNEAPGDESVFAKERAELTHQNNPETYLLRSLYTAQTQTAVAPVQLVSGLGHLYVFRQSKTNTLLVDRFVLDGMTNTLTRKLEVRFKRSKQKHKPSENQRRGSDGNLTNIDSLDFTDIQGNKFYEPTTELSLIKNLASGWFSVVLLPTSEQDKYRWHIFAYNSATQKVEITTLRASEEGLFEVKDYTILAPEPRLISGIIRRTLDLGDLTVAKGLTATRYDVQRESQTEDGEMQLLRDSVRVMLVVGTSAGNVAALSFAVAADGTLSQIASEGQSTLLRNTPRQVLLPLNTLDEIKAIGQSASPPQGIITSFARGDNDEVILTSQDATGLDEAKITQVKVAGAKDCNCLYSSVTVVDENTFEIIPDREHCGNWEVIPEEETGLVYNGIVTSYEIKNGKLTVTALNHGLTNEDEVQVVNTKDYNGTYTVTKIDEETFSLDGVKWQPGTAINARLQTNKRRGITFDEADARVEVSRSLLNNLSAFTIEGWVRAFSLPETTVSLFGQKDVIQLAIDNKRLKVWTNRGGEVLANDNYLLAGWHHIAVVGDGINLTLYLDGQVVKTGGSPISPTENSNGSSRSSGPSYGTSEQHFIIGAGVWPENSTLLNGQISDVRIWSTVRTADEIKNNKYLQLTGREAGLLGYWRLDAIFEGENERKVINFAVDGHDGIVHGGAYVSAIALQRNLDETTPAMKYENEELVAVAERATYIEEFEFKTDGNVGSNNADGSDGKIFAFTCKGKKNRNTQDWITIEPKQTVIDRIGTTDWYKASSRFTVPDGVSMVRSFGIDNLKGNWTILEIRKHQIQLVSNSVTEENYTDVVNLAVPQKDQSKIDKQIEAEKKLRELSTEEQKHGSLLIQKRRLDYEISLLQDQKKTNSAIAKLESQISSKTTESQNLSTDIAQQEQHLNSVRNLRVEFYKDKDYHHHTGSKGIGRYRISDSTWIGAGGLTSLKVPELLDVYLYRNDNWTDPEGPRHVGNWTARLESKYNDQTKSIIIQTKNGIQSVEAWEREINIKKEQKISVDSSLATLRQEKQTLESFLTNQASALLRKQTELAAIATQLQGINLDSKNQSFIGEFFKLSNCLMYSLNAERPKLGLETKGALLGFVRPISRLSAIETCEGNVQLSYFNDQGRMRQTNFDATYDGKNPTGEQWIPDSLRTCLNFNNASNRVTLNTPVFLDEEWTIEAWFAYPLPETRPENSSPQTDGWNTLIKGATNVHVLVKREANSDLLGFYRNQDGFISSGYNLQQLSPGWYHLTAVAQGTGQEAKTIFYINGSKVGEARSKITEPIHAIGNNTNGQQFGKVAEVRIWGVALSAEEIAVNSKTLLAGNEPDLLAYYPFKEATGTTIRNKRGASSNGIIQGESWWGCAAPIGHPGHQVMQVDGVGNYVEIASSDAINFSSNQDFTIEAWIKADPTQQDVRKVDNSLIEKWSGSQGYPYVIRYNNDDGKIRAARWNGTAGSSLASQVSINDGAFHHIAFVKQGSQLTLYIDGDSSRKGAMSQDTTTGNTQNNSPLFLGCRGKTDNFFKGQISDLRIWNKAQTQAEIQANMYQCLTGKESGLMGYWKLDNIITEGSTKKVLDLTADQRHGTVHQAILVLDQTLPIVRDAIVCSEYSTIDQNRTAMMRRFFASPTSQGVQLLPGKRVEELELKWIGNGQFAPTLLGYIEGPPPIPSENLTLEQNYNSATSVELALSEDVQFKWTRSDDTGLGMKSKFFAGVNTEENVGLGFTTKVSEVKAGAKGELEIGYKVQKATSITSSSSLKMADTLKLCGTQEQTANFPHLGKRFIPKNIGYALVVSALADIFVTRLKRTKRMIGYQVLPVENIPPDVNTITFLINPAYTMSGSLDGLTGSSATSQRFFKHVPAMRSRFGSLYPASYYRLQEAYDLKQKIEQQDKARESYFAQFNARLVDETSLNREIDRGSASGKISVGRLESQPDGNHAPAQQQVETGQRQQDLTQTQTAQNQQSAAVARKQAEIDKRINDPNVKANATECFAGWQKKMEDIQTRAGKRNIVNTYVWDADGGLRVEAQSFANTAEHSIGGSFNLGGALGWQGNFGVLGLSIELTAQETFNLTQTMSKTETRSKGIQLNVDLSGVESRGITDYNDYPILPGEKVGRYRFMSFYLEGSTDHFNDFFSYVVDPEWLASNSEEARALRQARRGTPNKAWRVLHRVTYVERPALMGFGQDLRQLPPVNSVNDLGQLQAKVDNLEQQNAEIQRKLTAILKKLSS